ncbi:MAG: hypothetical protein NQU46_06210 [Methanolinea sp.]|nr:hypothetical protein [Methanolinea sp.]
MNGRIQEPESGISSTVSVILMVILVIGIALVLWSVFMGYLSILHHTVYIASEAKAEEIIQPGGLPMEIVALTIREAEPFHFAGQNPPCLGQGSVDQGGHAGREDPVPDALHRGGKPRGKNPLHLPELERLFIVLRLHRL